MLCTFFLLRRPKGKNTQLFFMATIISQVKFSLVWKYNFYFNHCLRATRFISSGSLHSILSWGNNPYIVHCYCSCQFLIMKRPFNFKLCVNGAVWQRVIVSAVLIYTTELFLSARLYFLNKCISKVRSQYFLSYVWSIVFYTFIKRLHRFTFKQPCSFSRKSHLLSSII